MNTRMRGWQASDEQRPLSGLSVLAERVFRQGDAPAVRRFARTFGAQVGLTPLGLSDFVLAVNEAAASAVAGGAPCCARVRLWMRGRRAFCQVHGDGLVLRQVRGSERCGPGYDQAEALRRVLLRRLSDCVSFTSGPDGVTVLLSMTVARA